MKISRALAMLAISTLSIFPITRSDAAPVYGFEWTPGTPVITSEIMGTPKGEYAGVDQAAFLDKDMNIHLMFASYNNTKRAAISTDNGNTWSADKNFVWPKFSIDNGPGAYFAVSEAPEGGYRAFVSFGEKGLASAHSADGSVWTAEPGIRLNPSAFGLQKITAGNPIKLKDGTYRMYVGDDSDYFHKCASDSTITTNIYSAISKDQLNWTVEPGIRIGSNVTNLCKLHPQAFVDTNGKFGVVYTSQPNPSVMIGPNSPFYDHFEGCFEALSDDGVTFNSQKFLPVGGKKITTLTLPRPQVACSDISLLILPDKSARIFYANNSALPQQSEIWMSVGTPSTGNSQNSNQSNNGNGNNGNGNNGNNSTSNSQNSSNSSTSSKPSPSASSLPKKIIKITTITCVKGKLTKKITGANPKCPVGFNQK